MTPSVDSFVADFTVRYYEGRRTTEPHLIDLDELKLKLEAARGVAMAERIDEEAVR
jgi:hypothetical protein